MYCASEIREGLLKEFQRNGYDCIERNNSFYVRTKKYDYITCQKLRSYANSIVIDIVIKDNISYGSSIIDSYTVNLSRENFEYDFKNKIIDDLVKSGYLDRKEVIEKDKVLSENEIKNIFENTLNEAIKEENIYGLPQSIVDKKSSDTRYTTYFEYINYNIFGLDYRISYAVKVIVSDKGFGRRIKEFNCNSISLKDLKDSFKQQIHNLKIEGFIEDKTLDMVYKEFCNRLSEGVTEDELKNLFNLAYNKGYDDGKRSLSRGVNSMFLRRLEDDV